VKLTAHFNDSEIKYGDIPPAYQVAFLDGLLYVMEPIRVAYGRAIRINSAWRSKAHNASDAVKGQKNSQHLGLWWSPDDVLCYCAAFDFEDWHTGLVDDLWPVCTRLVLAREIPCDRLIRETHGEKSCIHVSYVVGREPRYEIREETVIDGVKSWPLWTPPTEV